MKVIIVGGGFGGLKLARRLNNKPGFEVLLIDKFNYHQFQPLFYQVATAGLDASNISFPLRKAFQKSKNVRIRITELSQIIPTENKIITAHGEEHYDVLVLATGADTNFFGNQQLEEYSFPMKSTVEALRLRYKLIQNFEDALTVKNEEDLQRLMNIVVVGGGPTGVEISGALAEMGNQEGFTDKIYTNNYWTPENPDARFPRPTKYSLLNIQSSDRMLIAECIIPVSVFHKFFIQYHFLIILGRISE